MSGCVWQGDRGLPVSDVGMVFRLPYRPVIRSRGQGAGDLGFIFCPGEASDVPQTGEEPVAGFQGGGEVAQEGGLFWEPGEVAEEEGFSQVQIFNRSPEVEVSGFLETADGRIACAAQTGPVEVVGYDFIPGVPNLKEERKGRSSEGCGCTPLVWNELGGEGLRQANGGRCTAKSGIFKGVQGLREGWGKGGHGQVFRGRRQRPVEVTGKAQQDQAEEDR